MHEAINETTTITIGLVTALLGVVGSGAFFLTRFATRAELKETIILMRDEFIRVEQKLDALMVRVLERK